MSIGRPPDRSTPADAIEENTQNRARESLYMQRASTILVAGVRHSRKLTHPSGSAPKHVDASELQTVENEIWTQEPTDQEVQPVHFC